MAGGTRQRDRCDARRLDGVAIFQDGGRQYRVQPGDTFKIDLRDGTEAGQTLTFDRNVSYGSYAQRFPDRHLNAQPPDRNGNVF